MTWFFQPLLLFSTPGATWIDALDTGISVDVTAGDVSLRLRLAVEETGGALGPSAYKIRYSKNGGAYTDLTAASADVQTFASAWYADGDDIPQIITSGTYQADNNAAEESTGAFTLAAGLAASTKFECETTLKCISANLADADTLDFRITQADGTVLDTYSQTPRITIAKSVTPKTFSASDSMVFAADSVKGFRVMRAKLSDDWNA